MILTVPIPWVISGNDAAAAYAVRSVKSVRRNPPSSLGGKTIGCPTLAIPKSARGAELGPNLW